MIVKSELVENDKAKNTLLTEFFPRKRSRSLPQLNSLAHAPTEAIAVEGSVAAEVRTDPNKPPELGELFNYQILKKKENRGC